MMRLDGLRGFAAEHGCPLISIEDLVAYLDAARPGGQATVPAGNEEMR
jgi:3,4-dihydroxy 2-butanone 4-phosphate synthase/3,4-dihydroxy 2-butanone 4-phosphate synthase/GTP cyclohydrolase II